MNLPYIANIHSIVKVLSSVWNFQPRVMPEKTQKRKLRRDLPSVHEMVERTSKGVDEENRRLSERDLDK